MELKVIAYAHNGHSDKFGIPRQSREESPILTRIVFEPEYQVQEALRGIEGFSHLWLIWGFNTDSWSPTVRPPLPNSRLIVITYFSFFFIIVLSPLLLNRWI